MMWLKKLFTSKEAIATQVQFEAFLSLEASKICGNAVMKYAQKRLGKLHYSLSKDPNYAKELIGCQIKLHAEVLTDLGIIIAALFKVDIDKNKQLKAIITDIHQRYVATAPQEFAFNAVLTEAHFAKKDSALKGLAGNTGEKLFKLLPMTDNLIASDVGIFQGQIRLVYIDLLTKFSKRYDKTALKSALFTL